MPLSLILSVTLVLAAAAAAVSVLVSRRLNGYALAVLAIAPFAAALVWLLVSPVRVPTATHPETTAAAEPVTEPSTRSSAAETAQPPEQAESQTLSQAPTQTASIVPMSGAKPSGLERARERLAAEQLRLAGRYAQARDAFRKLASRSPQDADAWADAADCAATAAGGNLDAGASDVARALSLQPNHPKGLWLKASLELQHRRYDQAAVLWEKLLSVLPPDSEDRRLVLANLEEAKALAGKSAKAGR